MKILSEFFKIISDETRLRILMVLSQKELCVCEICEILQESQPKISRHLSKLRDAGLVRDNRNGQWVFYSIDLSETAELEIIEIIAKNRVDYQILNDDLERLAERINQKKLCIREG